jgi:cytochrome-b5 reductase
MAQVMRLLMSEFVTHDTRRFIFEKPEGLWYQPGQAISVALSPSASQEEQHPFTPTSVVEDLVLELTMKRYQRQPKGITEQIHELKAGDVLHVFEVFGSIIWHGPGVFIAGGTGITPFVAIFRQLCRQGGLEGCRLLFSNKTHADIILERELTAYFADRCTFTLTRETRAPYDDRHIDRSYIKEKIGRFDQPFYVCGPRKFVKQINQALLELGAKGENLVYEK